MTPPNCQAIAPPPTGRDVAIAPRLPPGAERSRRPPTGRDGAIASPAYRPGYWVPLAASTVVVGFAVPGSLR